MRSEHTYPADIHNDFLISFEKWLLLKLRDADRQCFPSFFLLAKR